MKLKKAVVTAVACMIPMSLAVESTVAIAHASENVSIVSARNTTKAPSRPEIKLEKSIENQAVYLVIQTDGKDIKEIKFRVNEGEWRDYTKKAKLVEEGDYKVEAYCIDSAGNQSSYEKKTLRVSFDDIVALPTVKATGSEQSQTSVSYKLDFYNKAYSYAYKFTAKDSGGNGEWIECTPDTVMKIDKDGVWDLHIKVDHNDVSKNGKIATCKVDGTVPEIYEVSHLSQVEGLKQISLIVDAEDRLSERKLQYSFDKGKTWSDDSSKTFTSNTTLKIGDIRVKDEAGNMAYAPWAYQVTITNSGAEYKQIQAYYTKDNMKISEEAVKKGYVSGLGEGLFGPDKKINRAELATMLNKVIDFSSAKSNKMRLEYSDVPSSHWAHDFIVNVQKYNLINTGDKSFYPNKVVTRGELAHALCQFIDLDGINPGICPLTDINNSEYKDDIIKIYTTGLMSGYGDGTFGPNDELTRAQVVTVINKIINISEDAAKTGKTFKDVTQKHWAYKEIQKASN